MQSYLTPEETAQQLKVEVKEIMSLIEEGKLRAISIGSNIRIPEPELEQTVNHQRGRPDFYGITGNRRPAG